MRVCVFFTAHRRAVMLALAMVVFTSRVDAQRALPVGALRPNARDTAVAPERPRDAWFGRDKVRHFGTSTSIQLMGYGGARLGGASRHDGTVIASVVTLGAGIGKELWDARRGRQASWRDLVWDAAGLVAGTGLARMGDPR